MVAGQRCHHYEIDTESQLATPTVPNANLKPKYIFEFDRTAVRLEALQQAPEATKTEE